MKVTKGGVDLSKPRPDERVCGETLWGRIRAAAIDGRSRGRLLGGLVCAAMVGWLFRSNLAHFVYTWMNDENYSHGFLVPLISLYFASIAARSAVSKSENEGGFWLGSGLLCISVCARLSTLVVPVGVVGDLGFLIGLAGVVALFGGRGVLRRYRFALAFLAFMVPLPIALYSAIAAPLQLVVSRAGASVLNVLGIPVLCEGNMMTLPNDIHMFVAEACSGMRQLTGFLALTTAVAALSGRPIWFRAIVVGSSVPIAMFANVLRVVLTGWIMTVRPEFALGVFHTLEGLALMALGLGILSLECWFLDTMGKAMSRFASGCRDVDDFGFAARWSSCEAETSGVATVDGLTCGLGGVKACADEVTA
jgi:exosortase